MKEYHKIDSVYKRDERGKFLLGEFSRPEFEYLKDNPWLWTEKIDGTNIRVFYNGAHQVHFGGRTENAQIPAKLVQHLEETFYEEMFRDAGLFETTLTLYGEGYGAGIQKGGGNYSPDQKFILFDVKIGDWWLQRKDVEDIAAKLSIPVVTVVGLESLSEMIEIISRREADQSYISLAAKMEGVVGTPFTPLFARNGDRIITKVKYKDFL